MLPELCARGHQAEWVYKACSPNARRCRLCICEDTRASHIKHRNRYNEDNKARMRHLRMEVLLAYDPKCQCCGEEAYEFLTLEHKNGDGAAHRQEIGGGYAIYYWAKKNGYPDMLEVLCMNCNFARGQYGYCPHGEGE